MPFSRLETIIKSKLGYFIKSNRPGGQPAAHGMPAPAGHDIPPPIMPRE
ncbi:hypothetical protein SXCC_01657 [Gluconacetobacter sp. SXCC-1]|nr:hypothetical protein SXCC_01657 [Gluconacetobacter sp. SXCC-1]